MSHVAACMCRAMEISAAALTSRWEGGAGADSILGGREKDTIRRGGGDDRIEDGAGNDTVIGGSGHDECYLGTGNDAIPGGMGRDDVFLWDGFGNDTIDLGTSAVITNASHIANYESGFN